MTDPDLTKFQQKLAERKAREKKAEEVPPAETHDEDLVPAEEYQRTDADAELDRVVEGIDILDAYVKWCGKMTPIRKGNQREGIKISCPIPGHKDTHPSAWINLDKQTWFCGGCQEGGDAHDLASFHFNIDSYKSGTNFQTLRQKMAEDFGFRFTKLPGGGVSVTEPIIEEPAQEPDKPAETEAGSKQEPGSTGTADEGEAAEEGTGLATVEELYDNEDDEILLPFLDWKPVVEPDTFLDAYMRATVIDDVPEEYHFFHGLLALGLATGRSVRLFDLVPVYPNLFVCTLGRSGAGKSKARYHLDQLLGKALPHDWTDPNSIGTRKISSPGSAEVLIHNFQKPIEDPIDPKKIVGYAPVRGLIDFNELSSLVARTNRLGSALTPTLMQFYDMEDIVATSSMTHGTKEASEPFASALATTQPKALRTLLTKADDASGFLNRWVFVPGTEKKRFAVGGARVDVSTAVDPLQGVVGYAGHFDPSDFVEWDPDAEALFTSFFHERIQPDKKRSENDLITRVDLLMKKLILLFAINEHQMQVRKKHVEYAIHCYQYLLDSYAVPAGQIGNTLTNEIAEAILHQIRRNAHVEKNGMTLNQIAKALKHRKYPHHLFLQVADNLVKLGYLDLVQTKQGAVGRPTTRYKYVD